NFFAASNGLPATEDIRFLQVSPLFSNRVYALTSGGRLFATDNAAGEWFDLRPGHTDALSLAIDPDQPWILYLGTAGNGVLRSTNSGSEWERIENALTARFAASLAVDPRNTSRIYAGTDDGVFLSSDGGQSWSQARAGLPSGVVAQVLVDPGSQTVFAALAGGGVYRSRDQGTSWEPLPGGPSSGGFSPLGVDSATPGTLFVGIPYQGLYTFDDTNGWQQRSSGMSLFVRGLAADAADPNVFYAGSLTGGVFKSVDRGESWRSVGLQDKVILSLQADPVNSGVVYAGTSDGVVKTTDGGNSWRQLGQKVHFAFSFLMDPRDRRRMLVGGSAGSLYRSQDGGTSWSYAGGGLPPRNIYALMIHPESGTIIAALDGAGLFRSSDEGHTWSAMPVLGADGGAVTQLAMDSSGGALLAATNGSGVLISLDGENWAPFNEGLGSLVVTSVVSSAAAPGRLLAATGDRGIFRSDSGRAWEPLEGPAAEITFLAIGPGGKLYAGSGAALFCSTDDGTTWRRIGAGLPEEPGGSGETSGSGGPAPVLRRVRVDPFDPNVVYAIVDHHGIFKSSDAGESFSRLLPALAGTPFNDVGIGENSSQVYAATLGQGIMASRDGGATWTNPADRRTIQPFVLSMAVNPQNPSILYAGTNFGVIKSADGGDSWSVASEGIGTLTVLAMAINPLQPEVLYAGTIQGVFESVDGGNHWAPLGGSMFHTNVTSLALSPGDYKTVYAGTEGGGVFRYVVP
ncbi:MAG TPA: YCF48-related protein, partial [Terriglobia bacterium]|nr:YCF48-related protein [Terriglobia bacterium]